MFAELFPMIIALFVLVILAYRKVNIIFLSVLSTLVLALLTRQPLLTSITGDFMTGAAGYVQRLFLIFLISVTFGKLMEVSGCASSIAKTVVNIFKEKFSIVGIVIACAVLVYGGVNALVVSFAMYPIALAVSQRINISRTLLPGAIAGGAFCFAATFPGAPSINNAVCAQVFGTDAMAAPVLSIVTSIFCGVLVCGYMFVAHKRSAKKGFGFQADEATLRQLEKNNELGDRIHPLVALIPCLAIILSLNIFKLNLIIAMAIGSVICTAIFYKRIIPQFISILDASSMNAAKSILFTAAVVGFGTAIQNSAGFQSLIALTEEVQMNPYLSFALITTTLCGFAGSGTGGMAISVNALGSYYLDMGLNPEVLHRLATQASVGLDTLPHNGAVNTLLSICGMSHKESYFHIFMTTVVCTMINLMLSVALCNIFY